MRTIFVEHYRLGNVDNNYCMMFFMAQFVPQISHRVNFFLHMFRIPAMTFLFLLSKRKEIVNFTMIGSPNDCPFRETSTAPAQVVVALVINSVEEGLSSILT